MKPGYRNIISTDLVPFRVKVKESDLFILAKENLYEEALNLLINLRKDIENYCLKNPLFLRSFVPLEYDREAPEVVKKMLEVSSIAGVGPMASVAGAIAEFVGLGLLNFSEEIIVENGGDVFIDTKSERVVAIYSGDSPFSLRIGIRLPSGRFGVATSSGKIGHSISLGRADSATVVATSSALADAFATALGNRVKHPSDIHDALKWLRGHKGYGVIGGVVIFGKNIGICGDVEVVRV